MDIIKISVERWKDMVEKSIYLDLLQAKLADSGIKEAKLELLESYVDDSTLWYLRKEE